MINKKMKGILFSFISSFLYALNVLVLKYFMKDISSNELLFLLYTGSTIGILLIILFKKQKISFVPKREEISFIFGTIICDILTTLLITESLKFLNASIVSLLSVLETAATIIISYIVFRNKINSNLIFSVIFVTFGGIILSINSALKVDFSMASILVILATFLWGLKNNLTAKMSNKNPLLLVFYTCFTVSIFNLLFIIKDSNIFMLIFNHWYLLIIGFFTYGLSILYFAYGTKFLGASKTAIIFSLSPIFSTILSIIIFNEKSNILFIISLILMIIGIYFTIYDNKKNN